MRCPTCRARNADDADWCTQCYASLAQAAGSADPAGAGWLDQVPAGDAAEPPSSPEAAEPSAAGDRPFRTSEDGDVEWRCVVCGQWSPLTVPVCSVCGHHLAADRSARPPRPVSPSTVLAAAVIAPGAGHLLASRAATGVPRLIVGGLWLLGGIALLVAALDGGQAPVAGLVLLAGWAALWGLNLVDVRTLMAGGSTQVLTPRRFLYLVVGVLAALVIGLVLGTLQATA